MKKEIRLNAFEMNCVGHQSPGLWTHPRDRSANITDLPYWIDLARTLERGRFDGLFLADVLGIYDVYGGVAGRGAAQRRAGAGQRPAAADPGDGGGDRASRLWRHLQPVLRAALPVRAPHVDARPSDRRADRLEHRHRLSRQRRRAASGRTSRPRTTSATRSPTSTCRWSTSCGKAAGKTAPCCAIAPRRIFADPAKVHRVRHEGRIHRVDAIHLCEPSPQRTPVLYQAGASPRGRQFAAAHAECVFINGPSAKDRRRRRSPTIRAPRGRNRPRPRSTC